MTKLNQLNNRKFILGIIVVILLICIVSGAYKYMTKATKSGIVAPADIVEVKYAPLSAVISATGTITPVESVEISSKITARIKDILVKENEPVHVGKKLVILEAKELQNKEEQARYTVNNARIKYNRMQHLYSIGAKSKAELDEATYNLQIAESKLKEMQSDLAETVITSPIDGVVVGKPITVGSMAVQGSNNSTIIMRVADLSRQQIIAKVDETDISKVQIGQEAHFTVDAFPGKTFKARVTNIAKTDVGNTWDKENSVPNTNANSVIYYNVTLNIETAEAKLLPAMTARVDIEAANKAKALVIPMAALKMDNKGTYVLLVNAEGHTTKRYITTGIYGEDNVEVTKGLAAGDKVSVAIAKKTESGNTGGGSRRSHY